MNTSLEEFRLALRTWTDGHKMIFNTLASGPIFDIALEEKVDHFAIDLEDAAYAIRGYPHPVGTFFLVVGKREAKRAEEIKSQSHLDVRVVIH